MSYQSPIPASAIVLAGGKSSRMGRPKALLPFDNEPLIVHLIRQLQPAFADIVVVAAPDQALPPLPVTLAHDDIAYQGPVGGILYGLRAACEELCFVTSCDAPFLNMALIAQLLSFASAYDVVVPHWEGRLQPLHAVYRRAVIPFLQDQLERQELRPIFLYKKVRTREVSEDEIRRLDPEGLSFRNMNSPEDYQAALALWRTRKQTLLSPDECKGRTVMPAQAGIQESPASVPGYPVWIPAFAGMTQSQPSPHIHTGEPLVACVIELFGVARLRAKTAQVTLTLPPGAKLTDALDALTNHCPELLGTVISSDRRTLLPGYACNLNGIEFVKDFNTQIHDGDHLLILSSDAGG